MKIEIIAEPFFVKLHGFLGRVTNDDYAATGVPLLHAMWDEIGEAKLAYKGINYWAYPAADQVFVGVELETDSATGKLEPFSFDMKRYARFRHIGPYHKLGETHQAMHLEIANRGLSTARPSLEIFGHWQEDETKLETDVLIPLQDQ